jgi:hypothetical protein
MCNKYNAPEILAQFVFLWIDYSVKNKLTFHSFIENENYYLSPWQSSKTKVWIAILGMESSTKKNNNWQGTIS